MYNKVKRAQGGGLLNVCGIIAEFDPFHSGHRHLIEEARKQTSCDYVVCILSTAFLQRGTAGLFSTRDRARMALLGGADAVFALPVSFSCAAADRFALGGVKLLSALGVVTHQAFGCENASDLPLLEQAAVCLNDESPVFRESLHARLSEGMAYPKAQAAALESSCGVNARLLAEPNNILAVAYLRQLMHLDQPIRPVAIQRAGSRTDNSGSEGFLPSSAIRQRLLTDGISAVISAVPASTAAVINECIAEHRICPPEALTQGLLYRLYTSESRQWAQYSDSTEGLEDRLRKALEHRPASREALLAALKTRRYTYAGLQRWLSRILLDLPTDQLKPEPDSLRLLGFRASAQPLMRAIRKRATLPLITKPARGSQYLAKDARAELIWSLGAGQPASLYAQSPIIIQDQEDSLQ